ncbi:peptidase inhibitor family I36 protein [Microbacterium sufflavum]|uniref:Peptidase inhibitor family I36 protein n=1 Tax=Microbacterium sufflavum TaxID=2851649 RepID=A0ABY4ICW3_9MICO|nr:peptidase inhibitor family I36 protein [Microbacterium sufflavum]UPL10593.1 peptidase inhibitor family I36 protein [Microbacterium sufflavum]
MKTKLLVTLAATALLVGGSLAPAHADESLHPDVVYALEHVPGGVAVDAHTAEWPDLGMQLTVPSPYQRAVGSCATGQYCAYSEPNRGGTRLSFSVCSIVSTAGLSTVRSIANARSSGTVQARNAASTVLASAGAGVTANVVGAVTNLRCLF